MAQRALSVPAEDTLLLFNVVPEDVGGNDGHPTLFHLVHLALPLVDRDTRIVNLAHDGTDAVTIDDETVAIPRHLRNFLSPSHETQLQQCCQYDCLPHHLLWLMSSFFTSS